MIPPDHVLVLGLLQFTIGLAGMLLRRAGLIVVISAVVMLNGVLLAFVCRGASPEGGDLPGGGDSQATGVVILVLMVVLILVGSAVLFSFERFRRTINVQDHDRMKH